MLPTMTMTTRSAVHGGARGFTVPGKSFRRREITHKKHRVKTVPAAEASSSSSSSSGPPATPTDSNKVQPGVVGPTVQRDGCEAMGDTLEISVDNASAAGRNRSVVRVRALSAPGLMRSVAWVLNGMDLVGHECSIATDASGVVDMAFEVTERVGSSGTKEQMIADADLIRDRLMDYLAKCTSAEERREGVLVEDGVCVDNTRSKDSTYVSVKINEKVESVISLYPIGNAFTGLGLIVQNGKLSKERDPVTGNMTKTWEFEVVRQSDRKQLNFEQLQPLMYTLALVCSPASFGKSHAFTSR